MAQYGEMLGVAVARQSTSTPKKTVYNAFSEYFNNPRMTKVKNTNEFSVYMSKAYCLLNKECRYLIAFVKLNLMPIKHSEDLTNLEWVSFQTRTLPDKHDLASHLYNAKRGGLLDTRIEKIDTSSEASTYTCDKLGLVITLLHTKEGLNQYAPTGSVITALETYQTIITWA